MESEKNFKVETESVEQEISFEHTAENYVQVLFWSFMLSQGNPQLQKQVLRYVVDKVGTFDKDTYSEALDIFANKYFDEENLDLSDRIKQFHKPVPHDPTTREYDSGMLNDYDTSTPRKVLLHQLDLLGGLPLRKNESPNIRFFANATWKTDKEYFEKGGRPDRSEENSGSGKITDKWFSFGVSYLIKNQRTGTAVIDALLDEAALTDPFSDNEKNPYQFIPTPPTELEKFTSDDLFAIHAAYNATHSKNKITAEEMNTYLMSITGGDWM